MATTRTTKSKAADLRKTTPKTPAPQSTTKASGQPNAIDLLIADHEEVAQWFQEYEDATNDSVKSSLSQKICMALTVHMQIEEELFYPPARAATEDAALLDDAVVEQAGAKHLIAEITAMKVGDDLYDAKIRVLGESIKQHVKEEQEELFPEVEATNLDLTALGNQLAARKAQLVAELSGRKAA